MRSLYVPLDDEVLHKLGQLARRERRHPKDTAALIIERAINEADPDRPIDRLTHDEDDDRVAE